MKRKTRKLLPAQSVWKFPIKQEILIVVIGYPAQSSMEPLSGATLFPVKSFNISSSGLQFKLRGSPSGSSNNISNSSLRQLCCKIILTGLEFSLKPVTYAEIFNHMLNWLLNWDQRQHGVDESDTIKSIRLTISRTYSWYLLIALIVLISLRSKFSKQ